MADGIVQVPPDSTGKKIDAASLAVGVNTVMRQRIVIADNSASAQFATVTAGALVVTGNINISAMPSVTLAGGAVSLAAGTSNIGFINNISATVTVQGSVILAAGTANFGTINNISAGVVLAAGVANIGFLNGISATVTIAGTVSLGTGTALIGAVSLAAGTANIGFINGISATVQVAIGTPFTLNNISATVMVATANSWVSGIQSVSHGPKCLAISLSATTTLVTAPGAGNFVYVTSIACTNNGTVATGVHVGWSGQPDTVIMGMAINGGFVMNFDPPWKVQSNEAVQCRVDPASVGNCYLNINFFVSNT